MSNIKSHAVLAAIIALPAAAHAQSTPAQYANGTVVFSSNTGSLTFNTSYTGSATFNTAGGTQTYQASNTVNPSSLVAGPQYAPPPPSTAPRWTVYKQPYSVVIGNVANNVGHFWYIHDIVGQNTPLAALPTSGSYTYNGKTVWHDLNREGDFTYTVNLAARTGSGSITNMQGGSGMLAWTGNGTLNSAPIALQADGTVGVKNGTGSLTTNNPLINFQWAISGVSPRYDLALFGPNAQEVAGAVKLSPAIGSFGIVGTR